MPMVQPYFYWVPVLASQFNTQQSDARGVNDALQAKKTELGSKVSQLAEAALQAEAAMGVVEHGAWRGRGTSSHQQHQAPVKEQRAISTTIMLRNVPGSLTRTMFLEELESQGFAGKFDFVYLPVGFEDGQNLGHAFVNFVSHQDAAQARESFEGFAAWAVAGEKPCEAVWREHCQGLAAHIKKYRNSAVMHESVPNENKPVLFKGGSQRAFPAATETIKAPKLRRSQPFQ